MERKLLTKIFLLILGIAVACLTTEIGLRAKRALFSSHVMRYDGQTGLLTMEPNSEYHFEEECWENYVKANSQGFHDAEFKIEKPADVFRIAIIGDSMVQAYEVPIQDSFQYSLEEQLNQLPDKEKRFEVYSFGTGGIGTFTHYLYLNQYVLQYKPDLVVLAFLPMNDFKDDFRVKEEIFDKAGKIRKEVPAVQRFLDRSVLVRWLKGKWQIMATYILTRTEPQIPIDFQAFLKDYPPHWEEIWQTEKKLLKQFKETVEENQSKFLLVSLDDMWRTHPYLIDGEERLKGLLSKVDLDFDKPEKILQAFAEEEGISYLNFMPIFRERAERENKNIFWNGCYGHWDKTGHIWAAETIFDFLTREENRNLINN